MPGFYLHNKVLISSRESSRMKVTSIYRPCDAIHAKCYLFCNNFN